MSNNSTDAYAGYDHSTDEGGYGVNAQGDAFSRANQMGGEDPASKDRHYGEDKPAPAMSSSDSRDSSTWGSGANTPKEEPASGVVGSSDVNTESTKGDLGRDSSNEVGA